MTTAEGMARMEAERVPCGIVYDPAQLADDPHAGAIGLLVDDVHPIAGRIRQPRHPALFDETPATVEVPPPPSAPTPTRCSRSSASPTAPPRCGPQVS